MAVVPGEAYTPSLAVRVNSFSLTAEEASFSVTEVVDMIGKGLSYRANSSSVPISIDTQDKPSLVFNAYYSSGWKYKTAGEAFILEYNSNIWRFRRAVSGSADAAITWSSAAEIRSDLGTLFVEILRMPETSGVPAPDSNRVHVFTEDNGSGKTRLMARFPTGSNQQIAIQP